MKGDRQLCMAAVAQLASEEMKGGDRKLCMAAVAQNWRAHLRAEEMKGDCKLCLAADAQRR